MAKAIIKKLQVEGRWALFAVTSEEKIKPGDWVYNVDKEVFQCNQISCVYYKENVVGKINEGVPVEDGQEVEIRFRCAPEDCNYPFCNPCAGNTLFWIWNIQDRDDANLILK